MKVLSTFQTSLAKGATGTCQTKITNQTKDVYVGWSFYSHLTVSLLHKTTLYQEIATVTCKGMYGQVVELTPTVISERLEVKI